MKRNVARRFFGFLFFAGGLVFLLYMVSPPFLTFAGRWLVLDEEPVASDAIVVLNTGVDFYPRLIEAAGLYKKGYAEKVVINGNRKTDVLRSLEARGFKPCCPWYEDSIRILGILGVPRQNVVTASAENAYDTVSEARAVGGELVRMGYGNVMVTTSKSHTRRAAFIWKKLFGETLTVRTVAAVEDPYDPAGWWKKGRQIRWVLSEYGAWIYYWWKHVLGFS